MFRFLKKWQINNIDERYKVLKEQKYVLERELVLCCDLLMRGHFMNKLEHDRFSSISNKIKRLDFKMAKIKTILTGLRKQYSQDLDRRKRYLQSLNTRVHNGLNNS